MRFSHIQDRFEALCELRLSRGLEKVLDKFQKCFGDEGSMKDQPVPLPSIFGVLESKEFENTSISQQKTVL